MRMAANFTYSNVLQRNAKQMVWFNDILTQNTVQQHPTLKCMLYNASELTQSNLLLTRQSLVLMMDQFLPHSLIPATS